MSDRFMETQVTKRLSWTRIELADGSITFIPTSDFNPKDWPADGVATFKTGYGVRESAPGYLDCTDWEIFPTLAEAEARAAEIDAEYAEMEEGQ